MMAHRFRAWEKNEKRFVYFELFQGANKHTPLIFKEAELEEWKQFTNIYDKNHREICEGDIVKTESGGTFELIWNKNKARFMLLDAIISADDRLEIIGNIYENPELMEK